MVMLTISSHWPLLLQRKQLYRYLLLYNSTKYKPVVLAEEEKPLQR